MRRLFRCLLVALLLMAGLSGAVFAAPILYSIDQRFQQSKLYTIDPATGATLTTIPLTLANVPGYLIRHGNGLATNPFTQELYAILTVQLATNINVFDRRLAKIDPLTGIATSIGNVNRNFAGIVFASDGTLYGLTGNGAAPAETLFTIDIGTGASSLVVALPDGGSGEMIGYNPANDDLYRGSGNSSAIFESVDRTTFARTNISLTGFNYAEGTAMVYAGGSFLLADNAVTDISGQFISLSADGIATKLGDMDHISKGLAFVESTQAPAPGSFALLGLALVAGALARRKHRR